MATEKYIHPVSAAAKRPPGPFAWRFWPVSPRNVPNTLYRDIVKFNLNHQIAAIGYMVVIGIIARVSPEQAPAGDRLPWSQRLRALVDVWPVVLIFLVNWALTAIQQRHAR